MSVWQPGQQPAQVLQSIEKHNNIMIWNVIDHFEKNCTFDWDSDSVAAPRLIFNPAFNDRVGTVESVGVATGNGMLQHGHVPVDLHHLFIINHMGILVKVESVWLIAWLLRCRTVECYILSFGGLNSVHLEKWSRSCGDKVSWMTVRQRHLWCLSKIKSLCTNTCAKTLKSQKSNIYFWYCFFLLCFFWVHVFFLSRFI